MLYEHIPILCRKAPNVYDDLWLMMMSIPHPTTALEEQLDAPGNMMHTPMGLVYEPVNLVKSISAANVLSINEA